MNISKAEYFFYEWIILEKGITQEEFNTITNREFDELKSEYAEYVKCHFKI